MSTYSIFTASAYESTRYDNIVDILNGLPDNSSNLITPRNVRNAALSAFDSSIFKETSVSTTVKTYLGLDNSLLRLPILLGKKTLSSTEILDSALLASDTDLFIYNNKIDTNPSLQDTKISLLAGSVFNDYDYAPYIKATKITSPSRIDLSIINPATAGIINIGTSASRLFLSSYEYPSLTMSSTGSVLQFNGTSLQWNQVLTGTVGYIPFFNTSTTLAPSWIRQTLTSVVLTNGYQLTDNSDLLQLDFRNGLGIILSTDGQTHNTGNLTVESTNISLNGNGTYSYFKVNNSSIESVTVGNFNLAAQEVNIDSTTGAFMRGPSVAIVGYEGVTTGHQLLVQTNSTYLLNTNGGGFALTETDFSLDVATSSSFIIGGSAKLTISDNDIYTNIHQKSTGGIGDSGNRVDPWNEPTIASGQYTLALIHFTQSTNCSFTSAQPAVWMRVGNVVSVSGIISISVTSSNTLTKFSLSTPITSQFGTNNTWQLNGLGKVVGNYGTDSGDVVTIQVSDFNINRSEFKYKPSSSGQNQIVYNYQYILGNYPAGPAPAPGPSPF